MTSSEKDVKERESLSTEKQKKTSGRTQRGISVYLDLRRLLRDLLRDFFLSLLVDLRDLDWLLELDFLRCLDRDLERFVFESLELEDLDLAEDALELDEDDEARFSRLFFSGTLFFGLEKTQLLKKNRR